MLNSLNKLELDKKKIFLIILACLIIIYIDFAFLIKLQLRSIGTVGEKIIKLKKDMDVLAKDLAIMQQAQKEQQEVYFTTFYKPGFQTYARRKREKRK